MWINPLDKLPQIRQDYANHVIYSAVGTLCILLLYPKPIVAVELLTFVGVVKKVVDYFREKEPWTMCVAKAVVSALGAFLPVAVLYIK